MSILIIQVIETSLTDNLAVTRPMNGLKAFNRFPAADTDFPHIFTDRSCL
ncbi:MAG TPA: hypothetical protein VG759_14640 [Candidatus Angelobacter sp.]|nr:hypothetical protein [Candidatus Angelobacter sp.]